MGRGKAQPLGRAHNYGSEACSYSGLYLDKPSQSPHDNGVPLKTLPMLPDLPSLCRSNLAAIRAVLRLAVAPCAVSAGCHVATIYDMPICGCVRHEHIGRRIVAVAVMHIG